LILGHFASVGYLMLLAENGAWRSNASNVLDDGALVALCSRLTSILVSYAIDDCACQHRHYV
jgi:hypothetical protein